MTCQKGLSSSERPFYKKGFGLRWIDVSIAGYKLTEGPLDEAPLSALHRVVHAHHPDDCQNQCEFLYDDWQPEVLPVCNTPEDRRQRQRYRGKRKDLPATLRKPADHPCDQRQDQGQQYHRAAGRIADQIPRQQVIQKCGVRFVAYQVARWRVPQIGMGVGGRPPERRTCL